MKQKLMIMALTFLSITMLAQKDYCKPEVLQEALSRLGSNAVFLKDFQVHLKAQNENETKPVAKYSMMLTDSTFYQFSIASSDEYPGKAVFELYDNDKLIGSTYNKNNNTVYDSFTFRCRKSAKYHMFIWFIDGEEGCAVGVLGFNGKF